MAIRTCKNQACGKAYTVGGYKYCSEACQDAVKAAYQKAYQKTYERKNGTGHPRRPRIDLEPRTCKRLACRLPFTPTDPKQIYCCPQCSVKQRARSAAYERLYKAKRLYKKHNLL